MAFHCYLCNTNSPGTYTKFVNLRSVHSKLSVVKVLERLLGDFESIRSVDSQSNRLCSKCLKEITEYNLAYSQVIAKQQHLRTLLWKTENFFKQIKVKEIAQKIVENAGEIEPEAVIDITEEEMDVEEIVVQEESSEESMVPDVDDSSDSDCAEVEEESSEEDPPQTKAVEVSAEMKGPPYECTRCDIFRCNDPAVLKVKYEFHFLSSVKQEKFG